MREDFLKSDSFIKGIKDLLSEQIESVADVEIDRLCKEFRKKLEQEKSFSVGKFVNAIDVFVSDDFQNASFTINVVIKK